MTESLFDELKRYVRFDDADEQALRAFSPLATPHFPRITDGFYKRILEHEGARKALQGGESRVGQLKITLQAWLDRLLKGPWDEDYFELRCRIGRVHVRISLPQHYMFGAMNYVRAELNALIDQQYLHEPTALAAARRAVGKVLDLELAIMLHTYREDLLAEKARSERLSTFGQLVGSIGHELRNPLGVIETSLFILKGRVGPDERAHKHIERMAEQLGIANQIITDLLDMIRERPIAKQPVRLATLIENAAQSVHWPPGVTLERQGLDDLAFIEGDPGQLRQVFINLLDNAVHASAPSGQVHIRGADGSGWVEVAVEDTGPGVDTAIRRRLFEPLVTTKVKGIGLGLALVKQIVERHQGHIRYEVPAGAGARFVVRLPAGAK
ncbi:MAG: histidine kinase [Myxococcaceae bacterium]|nr:histidine kinase [Myxococcaceae bacterium]